MPEPSIFRRIDYALEKARWRKLELRGIYLDEADYAALVRVSTRRYRKRFGSDATVWPLSYKNELIIGKSLLPVKAAAASAVYSKTGQGITIPKRLSRRVRKPPA
jgi:hypothetical protein